MTFTQPALLRVARRLEDAVANAAANMHDEAGVVGEKIASSDSPAAVLSLGLVASLIILLGLLVVYSNAINAPRRKRQQRREGVSADAEAGESETPSAKNGHKNGGSSNGRSNAHPAAGIESYTRTAFDRNQEWMHQAASRLASPSSGPRVLV